VTLRTSDFDGSDHYEDEEMEIDMTQQHFTVFGGSFVQEAHAHGFNPAPRRGEPLAVWGFVLGSLLTAVVTVATVTVNVAEAALY
jgi:hypothetical protein